MGENQRIDFKVKVTVEADVSDRAKNISNRLLDGVEGLEGVVEAVELSWQRTRKLKG